MENIRTFIIGSSLVIAAWLTAAFFADTTPNDNMARQPIQPQVISSTTNSF